MSYDVIPARARSATRTCAAPLAWRSNIHTIVQRVLAPGSVLVLAACTVALAPRFVGAQATTGTVMTVRHTISAQVGTVTKASIGAPRRLDASDLGSVSALQSQAQLSNAWASTAALGSNVPGVLILESASPGSAFGNGNDNATDGSAVGGNAPDANDDAGDWSIVNAAGQLVPWTGEPIAVSAPFAAGRHEVVIVWVAPDSVATPPSVSVRVLPI